MLKANKLASVALLFAAFSANAQTSSLQYQLKRVGETTVLGTYTTQANCDAGARALNRTQVYICERQTKVTAAPAPTPVPSPPPPAPSPAPAPTPVPSPTPGLPYVNLSLIPAPGPDQADRRIRNTGEQPYRDPDGMGAFRTVCQYSHMNFDDPLVYPGGRGKSHLHLFLGNSAVDAFSTPETIRTTGNSTCRGGIVNRTGYWVPAIIDTTNGAPVKPAADADIYYKTGYRLFGQDSQIVPFPVNFRMIAGDAKSTTMQQSSYFECNGSRINTLADCNSGELRQVVEFPQCWDGVNLDSPDHRSHVLYASNGRCPSTHPVKLPEVSYHIKYNVPAGGTRNWRLSSDMQGSPAGSSAHGDWVNGWEAEVMSTWVTRVINRGLSGGSHIVGDGRVLY